MIYKFLMPLSYNVGSSIVKQAFLLVNLGTPDAAEVSAVKRYLREFLNDPRVIDIPKLLRWALVNLAIIPRRAKQSSHAYQSIWSADGSPLLTHSQNIQSDLQQLLGQEIKVELAMRYGTPNINDVVPKLKGYQRISICPLFPQYSSAATGSALEQVLSIIKTWSTIPHLRVIRDFYDHPGFIQSLVTQVGDFNEDYLLFSYHGLPERQVMTAGCQPVCANECEKISSNNQFCYRAQCFATTRLVATSLSLQPHQYSTSFQSRLGKLPWIRPYTDLQLKLLREQGCKRIAIICPSFVTDCLETLEEIGIQARDDWQRLGGESLRLIPCVNNEINFIKTLSALYHA